VQHLRLNARACRDGWAGRLGRTVEPTGGGATVAGPSAPSLLYIRYGAFSGSAISLRNAISRERAVSDLDLTSLARAPRRLPARVAAHWEARRSGRNVEWSRTAAWSEAVQREVQRRGRFAHAEPVLFVQTMMPFVLPSNLRYSIFTDRVSLDARTAAHRPRYSPMWLERERTFVRQAERIFLMGPGSVTTLVDEYGVDADRVEVVGAGPNATLSPPVRSDRCRRLLFVGTNWEQKGGPLILHAFAALRPEFPDLQLVLVGSAPSGPVPPGVKAVGRVAHAAMDWWYSNADAVVIASESEAFGIALIEALLKGLPCIGTSVGNEAWIVRDAGELVKPGDAAGLTAALRKVIDDYPSYRDRAERRGRELDGVASWDRVASYIGARMPALSR
jgi:glycosyltransferase involved in cell wall biosynthesis